MRHDDGARRMERAGTDHGRATEIYQQTNEGGHPIFVGTTHSEPQQLHGLDGVIRSDMDDGKRLYASALAAFAAGKSIEPYQ